MQSKSLRIKPIHRKSLIISNGMFTFDLDHSKGQSRGKAIVYCEYFVNGDIGQILLLSIHRMLPVGFQFVYLCLTLTHSKGQSQGHELFDCEYLVNGDRPKLLLSIHSMSPVGFRLCIYIWLLSILNVKVKVMQSLTVNIS